MENEQNEQKQPDLIVAFDGLGGEGQVLQAVDDVETFVEKNKQADVVAKEIADSGMTNQVGEVRPVVLPEE